MRGSKTGTFKIEEKKSQIIYLRSGKARIPIEKRCFDIIEEAFQKNPKLYLFVAALHTIPALPGSADELIRKATGLELDRGNYVCSMLQQCRLVQYKMIGGKKTIALEN